MMISRLLTLAGTGVFLPGRPAVAVHDVHVTLPQLQRVEVEVGLGGAKVPGPGVVRGGEVGARVVQHIVVAEREGAVFLTCSSHLYHQVWDDQSLCRLCIGY